MFLAPTRRDQIAGFYPFERLRANLSASYRSTDVREAFAKRLGAAIRTRTLDELPERRNVIDEVAAVPVRRAHRRCQSGRRFTSAAVSFLASD